MNKSDLKVAEGASQTPQETQDSNNNDDLHETVAYHGDHERSQMPELVPEIIPEKRSL